MEQIFKVIDALDFLDIFNKQNKITLVESLIKSTTKNINKKINNNTINMLWNELCTINNLSNISIEPVDNNLLNLRVKIIPTSSRLIDDFDNKQIKKEIIIKLKVPLTYPNKPHTVKINYPMFANNLNYNINISDYFKDNLWNPTNTIEYTIQNIQNIIENHGIINNGNFVDLQNILEKLSITTSVSPILYQPITIHNIPIKKINNSTTWTSGTGYGSNQDETYWDVNNYLNNKKKRYEKINKYLNKLLTLETNVDIINNSCLIKYLKETLYGVEILDVLENNDKYLIIFQIIKKCEFILDKELLAILCQLKIDFKKYIQVLKKNNELSDITKITDLISYIEVYNKEYIASIASNASNASNASINNDEYIGALKDLQFDSYPIYEHGLITIKPQLMNMRRVLQEIQSLSKSLPINKESSIFVKYDEENVGIFRFLITGPKDTPYQDGCFLFEMILNNDYPNTSPQVRFLTTGYGKVRFNPNLYACGKVCLSLLGTWSGNEGEKWNPKTSTLLQILVSIQSLIFTDKPYFNEPGYENHMNSEEGKKANDDYNKAIKSHTQKWAIENMIKNPSEDFKEIIIKHFKLKGIGTGIEV
jgi:ubiquitin-protein ligase